MGLGREKKAREDEDVVVISVASSRRKPLSLSLSASLCRNAHSLAWIMNHRAPVARENDEKNWPVVGRRDDNGSRLQAETRERSRRGPLKAAGIQTRLRFTRFFHLS